MGDFTDGSGWLGEWDGSVTEGAGQAETVVAVMLPNGDIEPWDTQEEVLLMDDVVEEQEEALLYLEPEQGEQDVPDVVFTPSPTASPTPSPTLVPETEYTIDDIYRQLNVANETLLHVVENNESYSAADSEGFLVCGSLLAAILGGLIAYGFLGRIR